MLACLLGCIGTLSAVSANAASDFGYDPKADPFDQYRAAVDKARSEHKLVLVVAGGEWCYWCRVLDRFVSRDADVERGLHDTFVVLKVYIGERNFNELFFSQLPRASGAPYFWIVSPEREVLGAQSTRAFEAQGDQYDKSKFLDFVRHWKQQAVATRLPGAAADPS